MKIASSTWLVNRSIVSIFPYEMSFLPPFHCVHVFSFSGDFFCKLFYKKITQTMIKTEIVLLFDKLS